MIKRDRLFQFILPVRRHPLSAFVWHVWKNFQADGCSHSAAALTYLSLFAVVPLLTVAFAMLSAVPAFAEAGTQIQQFIFTHFMPSSGEEIQRYLLQFSEQARKLTGIGIVFLAVTALTMLMKIESEFNRIWRSRRNRSGLSSFLRYWAILSLGPLCVGLAIGISTYFASLPLLAGQVDIFGIRKLLLVITPYVLTAMAFTLLFVAIPNARVTLRDAAIGGLTSALFFEIAKYVFAVVMANASYQFIYGTFAAIPLFLLWIYTSWMIVLAGAETAHAIANYGARSSNLPEFIAALGLLETLWRKYAQGEALTEREILQRRFLFERWTLSAEQWAQLRDTLLDAGLIKDASNGEFVLARNLQHYTLSELYERFDNAPRIAEGFSPAEPQWLQQLQQQLRQLRDEQHATLQIPLADIFERNETLETTTNVEHTNVEHTNVRNPKSRVR